MNKDKQRMHNSSIHIERISYITIICVFVLASFFQVYKLINGQCLFFCDEYAKTFLSVQVGVIVLPISLLALLSGLMREGFLGIGYIEYSLRIKPKYFKQKTNIMLLLLFLLYSVVLYVFHLDVLVFGFLIATFVVIAVSIQQLFDAIINGSRANDEIEEYFLLTIESGSAKEISFLLDRLYNSLEASEKDEKRIESIKTIAKKVCEIIAASDKKILFKDWYNDFCVKMMDSNYECGLFLVYNYYVKYVSKENRSDELFHRALNGCLKNANLQKLQNEVWFKELIKSVPRIIGYTNINESRKKEELKQILELLGQSLGRNIASSDSTIDYGKWHWLADDLFSYNKTKQNEDINYLAGLVIGLIRSGAFAFTKTIFFDEEFQKMYFQKAKKTLEFYIIIHCYLRYLAYYVELIDNQIKNGCINYLRNESVIQHYRHILQIIDVQTEEEKYELICDGTRQEITNILRRLGEKTKHGVIIDACQDEVTNDYWIFLVELLDCKSEKDLLEKFIKDEEVIYYYITYINKWGKKEELFDSFYAGFYSKKNTLKLDENESVSKLQKVKKALEKMYVEYQLDRREINFDTEKLVERIQNNVEKKIQKEFMVLSGVGNNSLECVFNLLCINESWFAIKEIEGMIVEKSVEEFIARVIEKLKSDNKIDFIKSDDVQLDKYLNNINNMVLLGSTIPLYRLKNHKIEYAEISKLKTLGGDIGNELVLLEPNSIFINNIEINVNCTNISINGFRKNTDGTFTFSFSEGMPVNMTEAEMRHLVEDESTRMEINVKLKVSYEEECVGRIFECDEVDTPKDCS